MDELGKSIPAAEAMVDAEQSNKKKRVNEKCLNCDTVLIDAYCHHCGQRDIPRRQTLGELLGNFISSFWSYEGKFFRTTRFLITSPGHLATEYNAGRRESYYHPARMYVFISFVFFLLYFSLPDESSNTDVTEMDTDDIKEMREDMRKAGLDSMAYWKNFTDSMIVANAPAIADSIEKHGRSNSTLTFTGIDDTTIKQYDSIQNTKPADERDGWLSRRIKIRAMELRDRYADKKGEFFSDFGKALKDNFSKVLFWLLPVFALLLKLLYVRRDFYYSEHLVLSIYYYNFFYLAGCVIMLVGLIPGIGFVGTILGLWTYFYFLFAMKHMYKQSWGKTILKFTIFSFTFSFLVLIAFFISAIVILMVL